VYRGLADGTYYAQSYRSLSTAVYLLFTVIGGQLIEVQSSEPVHGVEQPAVSYAGSQVPPADPVAANEGVS